MNHFSAGRWLRWLIIDHLLLIVLILMVAAVFSIPAIKAMIEHDQGNAPLMGSTPQQSVLAETPHSTSSER
ncbi:hypothetical protein [Rhizobium lentis]|uniref:Uncharacterized protein n=2 Tax=Rhizobium lentis TaxID=1138194 RepID=A0A9Q3MH53_9HYPH|nr:hypothetical protein [Rhizobium lentis]MBX4958186.1 hypothetical protein [Rhizobium lentis]MBX4976357.1 hypothetical protein [Rhizobium lentis]MBX4988191.1 hypothetical protein [Rhizobium lentis]MBX4998930.1 hypothetical protein [Rhizobium lentis]MBX5006640.1 hypothetical protein [Rhizobium lentis]